MEHVRLVFFFLACLLTFVPFRALAQIDTYEFEPRSDCLEGDFMDNSTFARNLNRLISSLSSLTPKAYGFYNLSSGDDSSGERAYAVGLCRREVKRDDCLRCLQTAARNLTELCSGVKQAVMWYTHCTFRYSNITLYGRKETDPSHSLIAYVTISSARDEYARL